MSDEDFEAPVYVQPGAKIEKYRHVHLKVSGECVKKRRGPKCTPILSAMYRELDRVLLLADTLDTEARQAEEAARRKRADATWHQDSNVALRKAILTMEGASEETVSRVPTLNRKRLADIKAGADKGGSDG